MSKKKQTKSGEKMFRNRTSENPVLTEESLKAADKTMREAITVHRPEQILDDAYYRWIDREVSKELAKRGLE